MLKYYAPNLHVQIPAFSVGNRVDDPLQLTCNGLQKHCDAIVMALPEGGVDAGRWRLVKGWLSGSGSHANTVVALFHWKVGVRGSPLKKLGKMHSRPLFQ